MLLLHGFPESRHSWRAALPALAAAGYRAVAPDQRGYSPGARPREVSAYELPHLVDDAAAVIGALGWESAHVVGHDWGAAVAWGLASFVPDRVDRLVIDRTTPKISRSGNGRSCRPRHHRMFV